MCLAWDICGMGQPHLRFVRTRRSGVKTGEILSANQRLRLMPSNANKGAKRQ
jgi:hypothetical protein